jgi:hypothetical protein
MDYFLDLGSHKLNICNYKGSVVNNFIFSKYSYNVTLFCLFSWRRDNLLFCVSNTNDVHTQYDIFYLYADPLYEVLNLFYAMFSSWEWISLF